MKLEDLPTRVKEFLGPLENSLVEKRVIFPTNNTDDLRKIAADIWLQKIQPYYKKFNINALNGIFNFLVEPLKNANDHGNSTPDNPIKLDVFMTPKALVTSYYDNGPYFKRQDVKEAYENKIHHPERHNVKNRAYGGAGTGIIYDLSDFIYVETNIGKLFIGLPTSKSIFFKNF